MTAAAFSKTMLTASWIAPMNGPLIREGAVCFQDGIVTALGPIESLKDLAVDSTVVDLGNSIVLPGLINAHTHLELSGITRGQPPARFVDWIIQLMSTPVPPGGVEAGIAQCLRFGVTAVGDITSQPATTRPILARSPLGGVSYGEVRAMAQRRGFLEPRLAAAVEAICLDCESGSGRTRPGSNVKTGVTPHAPYSIESTGYQKCLDIARDRHLPLATHLAETLEESTFLADQTGPFKELWDFLKSWDDDVPTFAGGPIRFAKSIGLLDYPTLLAHVNYCDDDEMALLAASHASVVYCPRTHAFFGHPPHRWQEMLARGINVAVGTDSCASSPDLNLVDELRLLHRIAPEMEAGLLWELATTRAATAIGCRSFGSLEPGNSANAVIFPVVSTNPLAEILECDAMPSSVWIGSTNYANV